MLYTIGRENIPCVPGNVYLHAITSQKKYSLRLGLGAGRGGARLGSAGSARLGSARLGSARLGSARLGSARLGSARFRRFVVIVDIKDH